VAQQIDVPAFFATKSKAAPYGNTREPPEIARQVADKLIPRLLAELARELDHQDSVHAQKLDFPELPRQGIDEQRGSRRSHDGAGMAIESQRQRQAVVLPGIRDDLFDDLLVAQMDTIENSDRDANFASSAL
jgi:hypothetical protein